MWPCYSCDVQQKTGDFFTAATLQFNYLRTTRVICCLHLIGNTDIFSLCVCVCVFLQQDDERIIQEIQKEGEAELNKKCAGQYSVSALTALLKKTELLKLLIYSLVFLSRLSSPLVYFIKTDVEMWWITFPSRKMLNCSNVNLPLCCFLFVFLTIIYLEKLAVYSMNRQQLQGCFLCLVCLNVFV